jgi:hypothetical protein
MIVYGGHRARGFEDASELITNILNTLVDLRIAAHTQMRALSDIRPFSFETEGVIGSIDIRNRIPLVHLEVSQHPASIDVQGIFKERKRQRPSLEIHEMPERLFIQCAPSQSTESRIKLISNQEKISDDRETCTYRLTTLVVHRNAHEYLIAVDPASPSLMKRVSDSIIDDTDSSREGKAEVRMAIYHRKKMQPAKLHKGSVAVTTPKNPETQLDRLFGKMLDSLLREWPYAQKVTEQPMEWGSLSLERLASATAYQIDGPYNTCWGNLMYYLETQTKFNSLEAVFENLDALTSEEERAALRERNIFDSYSACGSSSGVVRNLTLKLWGKINDVIPLLIIKMQGLYHTELKVIPVMGNDQRLENKTNVYPFLASSRHITPMFVPEGPTMKESPVFVRDLDLLPSETVHVGLGRNITMLKAPGSTHAAIMSTRDIFMADSIGFHSEQTFTRNYHFKDILDEMNRAEPDDNNLSKIDEDNTDIHCLFPYSFGHHEGLCKICSPILLRSRARETGTLIVNMTNHEVVGCFKAGPSIGMDVYLYNLLNIDAESCLDDARICRGNLYAIDCPLDYMSTPPMSRMNKTKRLRFEL